MTQFLAKMLWYVHLFEKKSDSKVDKNSDFVPNGLLVPGICHIQWFQFLKNIKLVPWKSRNYEHCVIHVRVWLDESETLKWKNTHRDSKPGPPISCSLLRTFQQNGFSCSRRWVQKLQSVWMKLIFCPIRSFKSKPLSIFSVCPVLDLISSLTPLFTLKTPIPSFLDLKRAQKRVSNEPTSFPGSSQSSP